MSHCRNKAPIRDFWGWDIGSQALKNITLHPWQGSFHYLGQFSFLCLAKLSLRFKSLPHFSQTKVFPSCDMRCLAKLFLFTLWLHSVQILKSELTSRLVSRWFSGEVLTPSSGTLPTSLPLTKGQFGENFACSVKGWSPSSQSPNTAGQNGHLHMSCPFKE